MKCGGLRFGGGGVMSTGVGGVEFEVVASVVMCEIWVVEWARHEACVEM